MSYTYTQPLPERSLLTVSSIFSRVLDVTRILVGAAYTVMRLSIPKALQLGTI